MISVLTFLTALKWIDGRPLQIEGYRKDLFRKAHDTRSRAQRDHLALPAWDQL